MSAPLYGRRPKRKPKATTRICMTPGCGVTIPAWKWLCDLCFGAPPYARKREICDARAQGSGAGASVFGLSRAAAEWLTEQRAKRVEQ